MGVQKQYSSMAKPRLAIPVHSNWNWQHRCCSILERLIQKHNSGSSASKTRRMNQQELAGRHPIVLYEEEEFQFVHSAKQV